VIPGVRSDLHPLIGHFAELRPVEGIAGILDATRVDEEGGRKTKALQDGEGIPIDGDMAIVDGDHYGAGWRGRPLPQIVIYQGTERNNPVAMGFQIGHLFPELAYRNRETVGGGGGEAVIKKDGDREIGRMGLA